MTAARFRRRGHSSDYMGDLKHWHAVMAWEKRLDPVGGTWTDIADAYSMDAITCWVERLEVLYPDHQFRVLNSRADRKTLQARCR
jgi:hypothetical protein